MPALTMPRTTWTLILLLAFTSGAGAQQGGTIEGVVSRADTGAPLAGAQVTLRIVNATSNGFAAISGTTSPAVPPITTDKDGRFSFGNLEPGTYRVQAAAQGFVARSFGQQDAMGTGTPILLAPGQVLRNTTISLTSDGTIRGRVSDENGVPVVNTPVHVFQKLGTSSEAFVRATTRTDDRGEYRLYGLRPGSYYLGVGDGLVAPPGPAVLQTPRTVYVFQLFPGVDHIDQAVPLELNGGNELVIDMKTRREVTYRVQGSIIDSATGRPPGRASLKSFSRSPVGGTRTENLTLDYNPSTGIFEVRVASGSHILQAQTQILDAASMAAGEAAWSMFPTARAPIVVKDQDLDGIKMVLKRPAAVSGRVRFEGGPPVALSNATLHLEPVAEVGMAWMPPTAFIKPDGTFRVDGLIEGEYAVGFVGRPQGFYVRSIQYEGIDILSEQWRFSGTGSGTVDVLLRVGTSRLTGTVTDSKGLPVAGGQVVLVPEKRSYVLELYPITLTDQSGRFLLNDVVPGVYRAFSWVNGEPVENIIRQFEQQGRTVRLLEASNETVDLRVIPR